MSETPLYSGPPYDALVLFSGGLDSILACKVLQEQGLRVLGLHYVSPFFGKPHLVEHWKETYGIDAVPVDIRRPYLDMLAAPENGWGKHLNPCVDCKILMLRHAKGLLPIYGAHFLATGEVLGQRPMSQRPDSLNRIKKGSGARDVLLRPLSAGKLAPTRMELSGLVDRTRLPALWGRGRKGQLELAAHFGITDFPAPGGGCRLAEAENARRYRPILANLADPVPADFALSHLGRQYWSGPYWLSIGRNQEDNEALEAALTPSDILLRLRDVPGPMAIARQYAPGPDIPAGTSPQAWPEHVLDDAAAFVASYSPKARAEGEAGRPVGLRLLRGGPEGAGGQWSEREAAPRRETPLAWAEPGAEELAAWKKARRKP